MLKIITKDIDNSLKELLQRGSFSADRPENKIVWEIIKDVKKNGDKAVKKYTKKFDKVTLKNLKVDPLEIKLAHSQADKDFLRAIRIAIKNISNYHLKQVPRSWVIPAGDESAVGMRYSPVSAAGVYVPGGRALYPSSLLMNVIPAKVAGVPRVCVVTPPDNKGSANSLILAAACELGIEEIYLCGGAQSIAALTYGTESIPAVDVIAGPGNIYMTLAKKLLYGEVGIDKLAGPSDSLILADNSANIKFVAADLITQAEHDPLASSILICNDIKIAKAVAAEVSKQANKLPRCEIIKKSFADNGAIIVIKDDADFVRLADMVAPEHLQIMLKDPEKFFDKINNAGAVFLGNYSPESLGDYIAGPNHVLPTGGSARFASPLGVEDFLKRTSLIKYNKKDLKVLAPEIAVLAKLEGLDGHANSVNIRF